MVSLKSNITLFLLIASISPTFGQGLSGPFEGTFKIGTYLRFDCKLITQYRGKSENAQVLLTLSGGSEAESAKIGKSVTLVCEYVMKDHPFYQLGVISESDPNGLLSSLADKTIVLKSDGSSLTGSFIGNTGSFVLKKKISPPPIPSRDTVEVLVQIRDTIRIVEKDTILQLVEVLRIDTIHHHDTFYKIDTLIPRINKSIHKVGIALKMLSTNSKDFMDFAISDRQYFPGSYSSIQIPLSTYDYRKPLPLLSISTRNWKINRKFSHGWEFSFSPNIFNKSTHQNYAGLLYCPAWSLISRTSSILRIQPQLGYGFGRTFIGSLGAFSPANENVNYVEVEAGRVYPQGDIYMKLDAINYGLTIDYESIITDRVSLEIGAGWLSSLGTRSMLVILPNGDWENEDQVTLDLENTNSALEPNSGSKVIIKPRLLIEGVSLKIGLTYKL